MGTAAQVVDGNIMTRETFLNRSNNDSTTANYKKSFKKLDEFYQEQNITEYNFIQSLINLPLHEKYQELQKLVDSIKPKVSPGTTKQYFDNLFIFFLLEGAPLDYTQKKIRLSFPRKETKTFEGLDEDNIKDLLSHGSFNFKTYMSALAGAGLRETEALLLEPDMIKFDEYPVRIKIPSRIAKYHIAREPFLPPKNANRLQELIQSKQVKPGHTIFIESYYKNALKDFEDQFAIIRTKCNLDTPNRVKYQQNDITLHSFRSYFITTVTDLLNEATAGALAGHSRYMKTYYRKKLRQRQLQFAPIMKDLEF